MNIIKLLQLSLGALRKEDETFLSYVHGKILDEGGSAHLKNADAKWTGVFFQSLKFFRFLQKKSCFRCAQQKNAQAFFFAGTDNQIKSLIPTLIAMRDKGNTSVVYLDANLSCKEIAEINDRLTVCFQFGVILVALALFFIRSPLLFIRLKKDGNLVGINKYFHVFCMSYVYIPYFVRLIDLVKPKFVIQSNDHNIENRCLRLASEIMGIKTVYLQHASVSTSFPPLQFDYAFLDGVEAMEKYVACKQAWASDQRPNSNLDNVTVFLSGQQKKIAVASSTDKEFCIGIGVNVLDDFSHLKALLDVLGSKKLNCIVRTHPYQSAAFLRELDSYILKSKFVRFNDSKHSSLPDFFEQCSILIAANTGLHLEAAIAGLHTYYYEFSAVTHTPDYYGFVRSGISANLPANIGIMSVEDILNLAVSSEERLNIIRRFSESFGTQWQGREGVLVAETLYRISNERSLSDIYREHDKSQCFKKVYRIAIQKIAIY
jgi:hypothetical protein